MIGMLNCGNTRHQVNLSKGDYMNTNELIAELCENGLDNNTIIDHVATQQQDIDALRGIVDLILRLDPNEGLSYDALCALQRLSRNAIKTK